jgi:hypothetical protein
MPAKKDITIRFCFNHGEGEEIEASRFTEEELADIRRCLTLVLNYVPARQPSPKIVSVQIIHDGITPVEDKIEGYVVNRKYECPLEGSPTPVVRFLLDRAMDEEEFRQCIFETSYRVRTESMEQNDEDPYFAEDHNGYSSALSSKQREQLIVFLQCNEACCGKVFHFPDGMPEFGHSIPAMEFALVSASR